MHPSRDRKTDPFYKPPASVPKTSAEIINEARNSLRTLQTQRPFTPREEQRKLFDALSSRTSDNRPPSAFSLHANNFDASESRPVSGTRLSPLPNKPKLPLSSVTDDDIIPTVPQPPANTAQRPSITRTHLLRSTSQGSHQVEGKSMKISENTRLNRNPEDDATVSLMSNPALHLIQDQNVIPEKQRVPETPSPPSNIKSREDSGRKNRSPSYQSKTEKTVNAHKAEIEVTTNEMETEWEINYWNENISPILRDLETAEQDRSHEDLCSLCVKLQKTLEDGNMLGKRCKRRSAILKTLYKLIDIGSDKLGLILAKLILMFKVSGKNLLNICKLVFKISRSKNNDHLFQNDNITGALLEVLQKEDVQSNTEAFLYCLGTIKFLSGNSVLLSELLQEQAVEILVELIKQIICFSTGPEMASSDMSHLVVQLTAALRNLADLSQSRQKFLACNALLHLCSLMDVFMNDKDICTNISRILSKLSTFNDCCTALADCSKCYSVLLAVLNRHPKKQDLVVRIVFTLSNLTAKANKAREEFYEVKGSIITLLSLLQSHCDIDKKAQKENLKDLKRPSEVEDVLIKLISLLANLSVHPAIGKHLAADQSCISLLIHILEYKSIDDCEELVINTVATLSNLSFYENENSAITKRRLEMSKLLFKLLLSNNMEGILEAVRVFGNLSHFHDVRDFIIQKSVYKFIVALLDSRHPNVCYFACGVVTNLATGGTSRILLKEEGTIKRLVECLRDFGPSDWQLAAVVCKALWNFTEDTNWTELFLDDDETSILLDIMASFLDERSALDYLGDADLLEYHRACWEAEFKPVATNLMGRIHKHHSFLEPLPEPRENF
ncbi:armadillo repeat-containing protein 2 isoform X2 [Hyperolius riggenbachi]